MTIRHEFEITFGDADPAGIAYYPRILDFCHRAFEVFFEKAVGEPYSKSFLGDGVGYPTVAITAEFRSPMRYGERIVVSVSVEKVGSKSATMLYEFHRVADGELCCAVRNVVVSTGRADFRSQPLPPRHAAAFRAHPAAKPNKA